MTEEKRIFEVMGQLTRRGEPTENGNIKSQRVRTLSEDLKDAEIRVGFIYLSIILCTLMPNHDCGESEPAIPLL